MQRTSKCGRDVKYTQLMGLHTHKPLDMMVVGYCGTPPYLCAHSALLQ